MKKLFPLFLLFCSIALVTSCSKKEEINIDQANTALSDEANWQETYDAADITSGHAKTNQEGTTTAENGANTKDAVYQAMKNNIGKTHLDWRIMPQTTKEKTTTIEKEKGAE